MSTPRTQRWACPPGGRPIKARRRVWRSSESLEIIRTVFAAPNTFAVVDRVSGRVIGSAGFTGKTRAEFPQKNDELGYALSPAFWGRGLMPEAVSELLRYAFEELGLAAVWCSHYADNPHLTGAASSRLHICSPKACWDR